MTRVNLIPPTELADQHLFAEFRELKMIPKALGRALRHRSVPQVLSSVPDEFVLGTGHVRFFYNKGLYLHNRYLSICEELRSRGVKYDRSSVLDEDQVYLSNPEFCLDYRPTAAALELIRQRIQQKLDMRPGWYRLRGAPYKSLTGG